MRLILFSCLLIITFASAALAQSEVDTKPSYEVTEGAAMTFDAPHVHIGEVKRGDKREMEFHFTNTGTEDLIIEIVSGCECTTLDWPRTAIKPGERGFISAIFDSEQKEKSETVEIDINLENDDPKSGYPMFKIVSYTFDLIQ